MEVCRSQHFYYFLSLKLMNMLDVIRILYIDRYNDKYYYFYDMLVNMLKQAKSSYC